MPKRKAEEGAAVTFDTPLPLLSLTLPRSFERFCVALLAELYPNAKVHGFGGDGDKQDGIDITLRFAGGELQTFQCKREKQFGSSKVEAAVKEHAIDDTEKNVILLARVATPDVRKKIDEYPGWELWDQEDMSRLFRTLPKEVQRKLVDVFFAGQRLALTGQSEAGPWQTPEQFFQPFQKLEKVFNHQWQLVGREKEVSKSVAAIRDEAITVALLVGSGGIGKTKVLKEVVEKVLNDLPRRVVRYLSPTETVTQASSEDLGGRQVLLVVDDAHDRDDLEILLSFASSRQDKVKLVLSLRPYGLEHIKLLAARVALDRKHRSETRLFPLKKSDTEALAKQVLKARGGALRAAADIARVTRDCPLATVVAAQVIAETPSHIELAQNETVFRETLMARFTDVVAGNLAEPDDAPNIRMLLQFLALVQPFRLEDKSLLTALEKAEDIKVPNAMRLMRILQEAGVLFKRGGQYRLSPDVLADYLIENSCIGLDDASTGHAEKVFGALENESHIEHLLLNLGKLDWRRNNGDPRQSRLIDGVWSKLNPSREYVDPHIQAISAVAFYQPDKALSFVETHIKDERFAKQLASIARLAAYNFDYVPRACAVLWRLGRDDDGGMPQNPEHAIRILCELCEPTVDKPLAYNERIVEFGLELANSVDSWRHKRSPYDFLKGILKAEGHMTESKRYSVARRPYYVRPKQVKKLRWQLIDFALEHLDDLRLTVAAASAKLLQNALQTPSGILGMRVPKDVYAEWDEERASVINAMAAVLEQKKLEPVVQFQLARRLTWISEEGPDQPKKAARRAQKALPKSLEFRTVQVLVDGWGIEMRRQESKDFEKRQKKRIDDMSSELVAQLGGGKGLYDFLNEQLGKLAELDITSSPQILIGHMLKQITEFADVVIAQVFADPNASMSRFFSSALATQLMHNKVIGQETIERAYKSDDDDMHLNIAHAFQTLGWQTYQFSDYEILVWRDLLKSENETVARWAVDALKTNSTNNAAAVLELHPFVDLTISAKIADEYCAIFFWGDDGPIRFSSLEIEEVNGILQRLKPLPKLEGHWIEEFLAKASFKFPKITFEFFLRRLETAIETEDWDFRPINHGPYVHVPLLFKDTEEFGELIQQLLDWMKAQDQDKLFNFQNREFFDAIYGKTDAALVPFLLPLVENGDAICIGIVSNIINESHNDFVFAQEDFVELLLAKAQAISSQLYDDVLGDLYWSAVGGERSGTPGEPFPKDVHLKEITDEKLAMVPVFAERYALYKQVNEHASAKVSAARREAEESDDE